MWRRLGPARLVRARFLLSLLCGAVEVDPDLVGEINLDGARVIGELGFPGVTFKHRLRLNNCYIPDGIELTEGTAQTLRLEGCRIAAIYLLGAKIDGSLTLSGAHVGGTGRRRAMSADRLALTGNMYCNDGFLAQGEVKLSGASIGGQLIFRGAYLDGNGESALTADGLKVSDAMFCDEGFQTCGEVRLVGARVAGPLHLNAAHLDGNGEPALTADGLTVADLFGRQGFQADGQIKINDALIGGDLDLSGARLDGKGRPALTADRARVTGNMRCSEEFQASGEVRLAAVSIGSQLIFTGARLDRRGGLALTAEWLSVTGNMYCNDGFLARGEVNLSSASIGGQLIFSGAHLDGTGEPALYAQGLTVARTMFLDDGFLADGTVNLTDAKIGSLADDARSWPQALDLDGLRYEDLTNMPARKRLDWLRRSIDYAPQPYEQLAAYYRRLGHDEEARRVLLAKLRRRRRQRPWWARWWGWLQDALAGYGYAPGRAMLLLAGAFVAGWLVFSTHHPVPVGPSPEFNAALYTLDVLIPAPALGQASDFDPQGATLAVAAGLHILGWLLAITVIAAITRSFSRT